MNFQLIINLTKSTLFRFFTIIILSITMISQGVIPVAAESSAATAEDDVLFINMGGAAYGGTGVLLYNELVLAGANGTYTLISGAATLLAANTYDQIWFYDLSFGSDAYASQYTAIANWFNAKSNCSIIMDGRILSSLQSGRYATEGRKLAKNYYENFKSSNCGLLMSTDHNVFANNGANNVNALLGFDPFIGNFGGAFPVDTTHPLMSNPNAFTTLFNDSTTSQTPFGLQPNGTILYTVGYHSGNISTPGISSNIKGSLGFLAKITGPANSSSFTTGETINFTGTAAGGTAPYTCSWISDVDSTLGSGTSLSVDSSTMTIGFHEIKFECTDSTTSTAEYDFDTITIEVKALPPLVLNQIVDATFQGGTVSVLQNQTLDGVDQLVVTFNEDVFDPAGDTDIDDVTNPANYELMLNGITLISIDSVSYDQASFTATLTLNGGVPLPDGTYQFTVSGTTSITNLFDISLAGDGTNAGTDYVIDFNISTPVVVTSSGVRGNNSLPETGFAPGIVTTLDLQPAEKAYAALGDLWLEIPSLDIEMSILGVPTVDGEWDVSWLGSNAGWLGGTAFPTWAGNTAITGHVWDATNNPGPFAQLKTMQYGDEIKIHAYGYIYTYEVTDNAKVRPWSMSVLEKSDYDILTLITCEDWSGSLSTYRSRRAVHAVLISVTAE